MAKASVAIVITTYAPGGHEGQERTEATDSAVSSWAKMTGADSFTIVTVDDGSAPDHAWWLQRHIGNLGVFIETPRLGCAGALRAGARYVVENDLADAIFYAQDDWKLMEPLDLAPSLGLIRSGYADVVRLGPTHPNLSGTVFRTGLPGAEWCLWYSWGAGGYVVGWRPSLYRASLLAVSLDDLDGLSAIEGERRWLERIARIEPRVFHAPNCTLAGPFVHLDTVELGEDAPETLTKLYGGTDA